MHSSRMRTAHLLTVSQHALHAGVSAWRRDVSAQGVCVCVVDTHTPPEQNDREV